MINLEKGCLAITGRQYDLLNADKKTVRKTCANVGISKKKYKDLRRNANLNPMKLKQKGSSYVDNALMQALTILSYVALNSDKGINKHIGENIIGIRCSNNPYDIHEPCFIDVNGESIFQIYQDFDSDYIWKVHYMNPSVTDNDYLLQSVMRAANFKKLNGCNTSKAKKAKQGSKKKKTGK